MGRPQRLPQRVFPRPAEAVRSRRAVAEGRGWHVPSPPAAVPSEHPRVEPSCLPRGPGSGLTRRPAGPARARRVGRGRPRLPAASHDCERGGHCASVCGSPALPAAALSSEGRGRVADAKPALAGGVSSGRQGWRRPVQVRPRRGAGHGPARAPPPPPRCAPRGHAPAAGRGAGVRASQRTFQVQ